MATDGPDPAPCDPDIYRDGSMVLLTHSLGGSNTVEAFVRLIAYLSGQQVDWHFAGGRVRILALGDIGRVLKAIDLMKPIEKALRERSCEELGIPV